MHKKSSLITVYSLTLWLIFGVMPLSGQTIRGVVTDAKTQETLPGVSITVKNTSIASVSNMDGQYQLKLSPGKYTLVASYLSYATIEITDVEVKTTDEALSLDIAMKEATRDLKEILVVARKNMEAEQLLMIERQNATIAVENIGAKEMSLKGLSTVADGVKKITGISMEGNSRVFVRGLDDRYSMTSLNGFPIASPNPDNKLIPLTLFPASTVKNITVSKVYNPSVFGDYSGAHIDIETKENVGSDYINVALSIGNRSNALAADFYSSDKSGAALPYLGMSRGMNLPEKIKNMRADDFEEYQRSAAPFPTGFGVERHRTLPQWGAEFNIGRTWRIGRQKLNVLYAVNFNNDYMIQKDAYTSTVNAQAVVRDRYRYDRYLYETTATMLGQINYSCRERDLLSYNIMYVNNTEDSFTGRDGTDAEGIDLKGSNSLYHIYALFNNQLAGKHVFAGSRLLTDWQVSYGKTTSDEPDRRQVMFTRNAGGGLSLFKLNQQETMRYFGELFEDEWNGDVKLKYLLGDESRQSFARIGFSIRNKTRDFYSSNFYYYLKNIHPSIDNIYDTDAYLNDRAVADGTVVIHKNSQPRNRYFAGADIVASFVDAEFYPVDAMLVSLGVRYEYTNQWVKYWTDAAAEKRAELKMGDLFPALNVKYMPKKNQNLRFSLSRTVTRPSFIEMAPFEYKESYGGATLRGNAGIKNGYNYNVDFRYELFQGFGNMYSAGVYYKHLESPIEKVQQYSGSTIQSFRNVDKGTVAGVELELRRHLTPDLKLDCNASLIYTHIELPADGLYTDRSRALQGASPYLLNVDLNYAPRFEGERALSLSMVYNLQGPRIQSVGINGVNNVMEEAFNALNAVVGWSFNDRMKVKFQAKNILNQEQRYTQKAGDSAERLTVAYNRRGVMLSIGFSVVF
jgi:outer membrane receptor protein involved in Fe transport